MYYTLIRLGETKKFDIRFSFLEQKGFKQINCS